LIIPYIHVGWFFNILTFTYYAFPLIYIIYWPENSFKLLGRRFNDDFIKDVSLLLLVCQLSFIVAEAFVKREGQIKIYARKYYQIKPIYIYILLFCTYLMFFNRWSSVGGFLKVIAQNRGEYMNDAAESSGLFSRYDILFYVVTTLLIYNVCIAKDFVKKNIFLIILYILFLVLPIIMGTRLILLTTVISLFAGLFFTKRDYLERNKLRILITGILLLFGFSIFSTVRNQLTEYFAYGKFDLKTEDIVLMPSELFTGVLSHHSIESGVNNNGFTYFKRLTPNSIVTNLGLEPTIPYSQQIANESIYSSGVAVYTIPFLTDLYFGADKNLVYFLLLSIFLYLVFTKVQKRIYKKNVIYLFLFYTLIYYVLRVESSVWFGRFYLSYGVLVMLFIILGKKIYKVDKLNNRDLI